MKYPAMPNEMNDTINPSSKDWILDFTFCYIILLVNEVVQMFILSHIARVAYKCLYTKNLGDYLYRDVRAHLSHKKPELRAHVREIII